MLYIPTVPWYIQVFRYLQIVHFLFSPAYVLISILIPPTGLPGLFVPYLDPRNGDLKPMFLWTQPLSPSTGQEGTSFIQPLHKNFSACITKYLYTYQGMCSLLIIALYICWATAYSKAFHPQVYQDLYLKKLNKSFGINYKSNGLLHNNVERVWVVTKVVIPKLDDISFPDIEFDPDCQFTKRLNNARHAVRYEIESICKSMKPLIKLLKQKEEFYVNAIAAILKEEIPRSLQGSVISQSRSSNQVPVSAGQRFSCDTRQEKIASVQKKKALSAFIPALAGIATIAVESLNSFLQKKRNKAMAVGLNAISQDQSLVWNSLKQLEKDFLLYGKYNVAELHDIVQMINGLQNRTLSIECLLTGQDMHTLQVAHMAPSLVGRMTFIHKVNLYVHSVLERQIRLYEWLLHHLNDLVDSIGILSTGWIPLLLFPPSVLHNISTSAIQMVHWMHPDYTLAIEHIKEYYDMKLATFGLDSQGILVVAFPVFIKDHSSEPKTLYEIETVKVPIPDQNEEADSYSELVYSKPYLAINND